MKGLSPEAWVWKHDPRAIRKHSRHVAGSRPESHVDLVLILTCMRARAGETPEGVIGRKSEDCALGRTGGRAWDCSKA